MLEFLRDNSMNGWAAVFGALAVILGLIVFVSQRQKKSLAVVVVVKSSIVNLTPGIKDRLELRFDGLPVKQPWFYLIRVRNDGNLPLIKTDFERPLSLVFGDSDVILSVQFELILPDNLNPATESRGNRLTLEPLLLNPKDVVSFVLIIDGKGEMPKIDTRIIGVQEVRLSRLVLDFKDYQRLSQESKKREAAKQQRLKG